MNSVTGKSAQYGASLTVARATPHHPRGQIEYRKFTDAAFPGIIEAGEVAR